MKPLKRDAKLSLIRREQTRANTKYGIDGRLKKIQPRPITLAKVPSLERKDDR